jgi:hypothetical protein
MFKELARNPALLIVVLICATIAVYFPILGNGFLYFWDDQWVVMNHYTGDGFTWKNLSAIFTEFYHGQYAPFNELLYVSLHALFGYDPLPFHLASLLLHSANVCLVYFCFRLLLEINVRIKTGNASMVAFLTAMIFAVHPFNVESVAWMSASKVLVYAFYYLAASYCFLLYLKQGKFRYYIFTLFLFVCSFLGKEQAVTFPVWMLLMYWMTGRSFGDRKIWLQVISFFILAFVFGILTMLSQSDGKSIVSEGATYPLWQRIVYACYAFSEYFFRTTIPYKQSYLYPFPSLAGAPLPVWLLLYPSMLILLTVVFWKTVFSNKVILFSLLFFLLHIAVALHIISLSRFVVVADRYAYIAVTGIAFAISCYLVRIFRKKARYRGVVVVLMVSYVLYMGVYANKRSRVWYDTDTLKKEIRELLKERNDYEGYKFKSR